MWSVKLSYVNGSVEVWLKQRRKKQEGLTINQNTGENGNGIVTLIGLMSNLPQAFFVQTVAPGRTQVVQSREKLTIKE